MLNLQGKHTVQYSIPNMIYYSIHTMFIMLRQHFAKSCTIQMHIFLKGFFLKCFRVGDFEFTPECVVFDLLNIKLNHGWLFDPQSTEYKTAIGGLSYNQLVEKIVASKEPNVEGNLASEGNSLTICTCMYHYNLISRRYLLGHDGSEVKECPGKGSQGPQSIFNFNNTTS